MRSVLVHVAAATAISFSGIGLDAAAAAPADDCGDTACAEACGESCGESCSSGCSFCSTDVTKLFHAIVGDELLLQKFRDQEAHGLKYSIGGDLRYRFMDERNRLRPGGPGKSDYNLWRFTPYISVGNEYVKAHVQAIDASIFGIDPPYTPLSIDRNRSDLLQAYVDVTLLDLENGSLTYRYGRQFLNYGSQRLLSPLAWANTYRNFEGHKLMAVNGDWSVDAFAVQNLNGASGSINRPYSFDQADQSRWLLGAYATYTGVPNNSLDLYYLFFDETQSSATAIDGTRHTIGMRVAGKKPVKECDKVVGTWNWDLEGAYQFGEDNFGSPVYRDVQAGMAGAVGGYTFNSLPWSPGVGGIFYWASGDDAGTTGDVNTFYSMYPLGHAWWGQIDNFGGMNLLDYGVQGTLNPHKKFKFVGQWHWFDLADPGGAIINIAGAPLPGSGDRNVGSEVDLVGTMTVSKSFNVQLGYFWFFYGDAVNNGPLARSDAKQLYLQATYKF
jgi:Alginate export